MATRCTVVAATNMSRNVTLVGVCVELVWFFHINREKDSEASSHLSSSLQLALATIMRKIAAQRTWLQGSDMRVELLLRWLKLPHQSNMSRLARGFDMMLGWVEPSAGGPWTHIPGLNRWV